MTQKSRAAKDLYKNYLTKLNQKLRSADVPLIDPRAVDRALATHRSRANTLARLLANGRSDEEEAIRELQVRCEYYEHLIDDILMPDALAHFTATKSSDARAAIKAAAENLSNKRAQEQARKASKASLEKRRSAVAIRREYVLRRWRALDQHAERNRASLILKEMNARFLKQETYRDIDQRWPPVKIAAPSIKTIRSDLAAVLGKSRGQRK